MALVEQALSPLLRRTDAASRARASELAPGDPTPHLAVGEALAKTDIKAARAELAIAETKIGNLPNGTEAWRRLIDIYHSIGSLTWTEDAIAKAKLGDERGKGETVDYDTLVKSWPATPPKRAEAK